MISFENWSLPLINLKRAKINSNKLGSASIINRFYLFKVFIGLLPDLHYLELSLKLLRAILKCKGILLEVANLEAHSKKEWDLEFQKVAYSAQSRQQGLTHLIANFSQKEPCIKRSDFIKFKLL